MDGVELLKHVEGRLPRHRGGGDDRLRHSRARGGGDCASGPNDFIEKPVDRDRLLRTVTKAVEKQPCSPRTAGYCERLAEEEGTARLVAQPRHRPHREMVNQIAQTDAPVLIPARAAPARRWWPTSFHSLSARRKGPLVKIFVRAIPENLLESELFGLRARRLLRRAQHQSRGLRAGQRRHPGARRDRRDAGTCRPSCCACCRTAACSGSQHQGHPRGHAASSPPPHRHGPRPARGAFPEDLLPPAQRVQIHIPPLRDASRTSGACWPTSCAAFARRAVPARAGVAPRRCRG